MSIIENMMNAIGQDANIATAIGLDVNNHQEMFNAIMAFKQIEATANGYKEKNLAEIRKIGFDAVRDCPTMGYQALNQMITSGELFNEYQKIGLDSQALYGAQELTHVDPRFWEIEHQPLQFRENFPVTHQGDPADLRFNYKMERLIGRSAIGGEATNTRSNVDVIEEDHFANYKTIDVQFEVTTQDMRAAVKTGRPIEVRKIKAANRSAEQQLNDVVILGEASPLIHGFVNNPDLVIDTVVDGAGGGNPKLWDSKTPEEILIGDILSPISLIEETTFANHKPTHMGMSIERRNHLRGRWIQSTMPISLLKWLESEIQAYGLQKIVAMPELDGAGDAGTQLAIFWENDENVIQIDESMPLRFLPPQWSGKKMIFIGEAKISDMIMRRKQAFRGIQGF